MDPKRLGQMLGFPIAAADDTRVKKPTLRPSADSVEAAQRAAMPDGPLARFSRRPDQRTPSNRSLFTQGRPEPATPDPALEGDLAQADINLNKGLRK